MDAFLADPSSQACERVVDRLFASPAYGERWGRHWLDVVRFAETQGFERNQFRPQAWKYRDWVIGAFNDDLPYDEFVRLQLAGDVLRPNDPAAVVASGFLVMGPHDVLGLTRGTPAMQAQTREDERESLLGSVGQTFLGLTLNCARCHDHKVDPLSQKEYYQIAAALDGVTQGERSLPPLSGGKAHAVLPGPPAYTHVLARGDPLQPGELVAPRGLTAVRGPAADFGLAPGAPEGERRLRLAAWVTDPRNPLTPRVIVNRLWHYHFGAGIVETPSDFGFNGGRPSHPELLDWLAAELMAQRWSLKALHRQIVLSATYRQESRTNSAGVALDAGNRLLWRMNPRRLEAEAVRDAVLAVAGELNRSMGAPGYRDVAFEPSGDNMIYPFREQVGPAFQRRTVYRTWVRLGPNPLLDALDCADPTVATPRRSVTTTPLQALALWNNPFMTRAATANACRLKREAGPAVAAQIERAYRLAYGRAPTPAEAASATRFVEQYGLGELCLVIYNSNEFLCID
jgi:hypothetical protein